MWATWDVQCTLVEDLVVLVAALVSERARLGLTDRECIRQVAPPPPPPPALHHSIVRKQTACIRRSSRAAAVSSPGGAQVGSR